MNDHIHSQSRFFVAFVLLIFAIAAYSLPWIVNPSSGLSLGADDLAEWTSLHPQVRAAAPSLLTPLLLRLPLVCLAVCFAFSLRLSSYGALRWWLTVAVIGLLFLFCLPPLEFFVNARRDPNYLQQFILAVALLALSSVGLSGIGGVWRTRIVILAAVVGVFCSFLGVERANQLMLDLVLPVQRGGGAVVISAVFLAFLLITIKGSVSATLLR